MKGLKTDSKGRKRIHRKEREYCTGCGACANICPRQCIRMEEDQEGFYYPVLDDTQCISCGLCGKVCPSGWNTGGEPGVYGMYCLDEKVREKSSSGGFFPVLAGEVIEKGGVVFGVKMQGDGAVFGQAESREDLEPMQGSKYVQCNVKSCYREVKEILENGRTVLFSGTPCQTAALYSFLGQEYKNLITLDFICHGVSSPGIFRRYLREMAGLSQPRNISFRDKAKGWNRFSMRIEGTGGFSYVASMDEDVYLQTFLQNRNLRPSCFFCRFRGVSRKSDFTAGDFWGCEEVFPEWSDDKGYSVILVHSEKGEKMLETIAGHGCWKKIKAEAVTARNGSLLSSPWDLYSRDLFFKYAARHSLEKSLVLAGREGMLKKAGRKWEKIKRCLRK